MSQIRTVLKPEQVRAFESFATDSRVTLDDLRYLGIDFSAQALDELEKMGRSEFGNVAMDAGPAPVTTPSNAYSLQFLQHFLADAVMVVTRARVADELIGRTSAGSWADQEIVLKVHERIGQARPYADAANVPLASYNANYEARTVFCAELGCRVGVREAMRASREQIDAWAIKRSAVIEALAISTNDVAFNGFNGGANKTYGILNEPGLAAYTTVAAGAGGTTTWSTKTYAEITADLRGAAQGLRTRSGGNFRPETDAFTLGVAMSAREYLDTTSDYGNSVMDFINKTWPKCRVVSVPQFDAANGGANVFYVIADQIGGGKVFDQVIQQVMFLVGITPDAKGPIEDYSNATAGALLRQPIGVVRYSGI